MIRNDAELARNGLCRCGSGKKFKKCCLPGNPADQTFRTPLLPIPKPSSTLPPLKLGKLVFMTEEELAGYDIAAVQLAVAERLPGAPTEMQVQECLQRLDHYAAAVEHYTIMRLADFPARAHYYNNSISLFRIDCMVSMLQRVFGVRYHPDKREASAPFYTEDYFIHGALLGHGGTCSSLPVVYIAVGRRLGYPLRLVSTKAHLFCRWDSPGERFNVEVNDAGLQIHDDSHFREGRFAFVPNILGFHTEMQAAGQQSWLPAEEQRWVEETTARFWRMGRHLQSLTRKQELLHFLHARGEVWLGRGAFAHAVDSFIWAALMDPGDGLIWNAVRRGLMLWEERLKKRLPPLGMPRITVPAHRTPYPEGVPTDIRQQLPLFTLWEDLLSRPEMDRDWWEPLRQGKTPLKPVPTELVIKMGS